MAEVERVEEGKEKKHKRINQGLTAWFEKPLLLWLSARMPRWITPDVMTLIGLGGSILIAASYLLSKDHPVFLWIACLGFLVNWVGDSLDGTLARYRKIERPRYGYFVDHIIDAISITMILTALGFSGIARLELAWGMNLLYILFLVLTSLTNFTSREFQISYISIGPTELRILAIIFSIWTYFNGSRFIHLPFGDFGAYEMLLLSIIVVFTPVFLVSTIIQIIRLAKEEPPPNW